MTVTRLSFLLAWILWPQECSRLLKTTDNAGWGETELLNNSAELATSRLWTAAVYSHKGDADSWPYETPRAFKSMISSTKYIAGVSAWAVIIKAKQQVKD